MTPQDYHVIVRKLASQFINSRANDTIESRKELLERLQHNPSAAQFNGFVVSSFALFFTPEQCASIIAASNSQSIDPELWKGMTPREALYAMAFELLKADIWNEVFSILQVSQPASLLNDGDTQLQMFEAA